MVKTRYKVLLSAYACEPNKGSEPGVGWNWAIHLAEKHDVHVITRENNKQCINEYLKKNPVDHLYFYYHDCNVILKKIKKMPNGIFIYYKMWQREILPFADKIVNEQNIDIVHHLTFNEFRTPGKLYKIGKPFVWGPIGGGQFYNFVFRDAYFRTRDILKEHIRNKINEYYLNFSKDIKNVIKKAAAILIADQTTEKVMPLTREYIRLIETAYNSKRNTIKSYNEIPKGEFNRPIRLLWVGGVWPRKGLKVLIDALGESSFRNFELIVIGNGQDFYRCKKLTHYYGIQDKVNFEGALSYEKVNEKYDQADLFIFTSLRDTSGNVVLEAMSHGLPVVTLNHHGAGEIVTNETGSLINIESYKQVKSDLVKSICFYTMNGEKIIEHGKNARERVETVYSWNHNIEVMDDVYRTIFECFDK